MNVSMLNIQLHNHRKKYQMLPARSPKKKGSTNPGRKRIIKTVNTRNTQILYSVRKMDLKIFKEVILELLEHGSNHHLFLEHSEGRGHAQDDPLLHPHERHL